MKNILSLSVSLWLLAVAVSCTLNHEKQWGAERWLEEFITLKGDDVYVGQTIWNEADLIFIDDHVIFGNAHDGKLFSLFVMENDSLMFKGAFLNKGRGPFELMDADIYYLKNNNILMLVGYNPLGKSIAIPLDNINNVLDTKTWVEIDYSDIGPIRAYCIHPIKDSVFLMQIFEERNNMYAVFDVCRKTSKSYLSIFYPDNQSFTDGIKGKAYHGWTVKHPSRNQYVYSNMNSKYVTIFTLDDVNSLVKETIIFHQIPSYKINVDNRNVRFTGNHQGGNQICVSEKYIYYADPKFDLMDYEGSIRKNGFSPGYFKDVYVSDWEGKPLAKYRLDRPVCYLQSDLDGKYLYAFYIHEDSYESMMVRFELPKHIY